VLGTDGREVFYQRHVVIDDGRQLRLSTLIPCAAPACCQVVFTSPNEIQRICVGGRMVGNKSVELVEQTRFYQHLAGIGISPATQCAAYGVVYVLSGNHAVHCWCFNACR
jgi:hypothetical protein